jgi:hypothetical protein
MVRNKSTLDLNVEKMDPPEQPPRLSGELELGGELTGLVGPYVLMCCNVSDTGYREGMRPIDGETILLDIDGIERTTLEVQGNVVVAKEEIVDNPTLEVRIRGVDPDRISTLLTDRIPSAISPLLEVAVPVMEPLLTNMFSDKIGGLSFFGLIWGLVGTVREMIADMPSLIRPALSVIIRSILLGLSILGGLITRKIVIRGRIYMILQTVEPLILSLLSGEQDIEALAEKARDIKEFGSGPPSGGGI